MIHIAVLGFEGTPLTALSLPMDILNSAGYMYNKIAGLPEEKLFDVSLVTPGGKAISCFRSVQVVPKSSFEKLEAPDVLIVGPAFGLNNFQQRYGSIITNKLKELHGRGTILASICVGSFVLAATGLLNGKGATTHWGMCRRFAEMFPDVNLYPEQIVVDEGSLLTSGGTTAGADLTLHLVRRFYGKQVADRCARVLLLYPYRSSQLPFTVLTIPVDHGDGEIGMIQEWIHDHFAKSLTVDKLATHCAMSRRTFERRFKKATGESPLQYIQRIRIEKAKQLLESTGDTFEEITFRVGYEDPSTFRRIFQRYTGLLPGEYRSRFST